jgi:sulfatase maturation enzyme AslB (radical SAM superfamily)
MKWFIAYHILFDCNLRCSYCFHYERFISNYYKPNNFTIEQYKKFRNTHLLPAEDLLVHFHGGEPFIDTNINIICNIMKNLELERFDFLTNGIQKIENYKKILPFKNKINQIGFTYHRKMIDSIPELVKKFEENVLFLYNQGIPVYVKELLFIEEREKIKENKRRWKNLNIPFKIQDFKGYDRGKDFNELKKYTIEDWLLVDFDYKKFSKYCSCKRGYKNVLIGGHTLSGLIFGCFEDMKIVGNIIKNEFNLNYNVLLKPPHGLEVINNPPIYYQEEVFREKGVYKSKKSCGND